MYILDFLSVPDVIIDRTITGVFLIFLMSIRAAMHSFAYLWSTLIINLLFLYFSLMSRGEAWATPNSPRKCCRAARTASSTSPNKNTLVEIISKTTYLFFDLSEGSNFILQILLPRTQRPPHLQIHHPSSRH